MSPEIERDALRAEVERLREQNDVQAEELSGWRNAHTNFASRCVGCVFAARLLRASQSLRRAWRREREEVESLRLDVGRLLVAYGSRDEFDGVDDAIEDAAEMRAENNRLRAFVRQLQADGLDIDDPDTAPAWTGKIHRDGRLVFDLATARACDPITAEMHAATCIPYSARCHHQDRPHCAGCPDDAGCEASGREPSESAPPLCTWCGKPVETDKGMRVTRTDAAGVADAFHWACWSAHVEQANGLAKGTP